MALLSYVTLCWFRIIVMDSEFFERSLLSLEQRYKDLLVLHETRRISFSTELQEQSSRAQVQVDDLTQQLEQQSGELLKAQQTVEDLQDQLKLSQEQLKLSAEDTERVLLQLHQVQEELEHYFLLSRSQSKILTASAKLTKKAFSLVKC